MSKQQMLPVGGQQRGILGRLVTFVIVLGLIAWFIKSPVDAANAVKTGWDWFMSAVDSVVTFVDNVAG